MEIAAHLADPVMEGRGPGTAGINRARDYLIEQFRATGLEPAFGPADQRTHLQTFRIALDPDVPQQALELQAVGDAASPGTMVPGASYDERQADRGAPLREPPGQARGTVEVERPHATVANVGALVRGAGDLADEVVVVGAHYDHLGYGGAGSMVPDRALHPGADDNASGTAGLVLLARALAERVRDGTMPARRTALFLAFAGEERGLLGSGHFVRHLEDAGLSAGRISAMINMDMIGRLEGRRLYVFGTGSGDRWRRRLYRANHGPRLRLDTAGSAIVGASDRTQFYVHRIPALHFFTGAHADYHRPSDTADKLDADGAAAVLHLIDGLLASLLAEPRRLAFVEDASLAPPPGPENARASKTIVRRPVGMGPKENLARRRQDAENE